MMMGQGNRLGMFAEGVFQELHAGTKILLWLGIWDVFAITEDRMTGGKAIEKEVFIRNI